MDPTRQQKILDLIKEKLAEGGADLIFRRRASTNVNALRWSDVKGDSNTERENELTAQIVRLLNEIGGSDSYAGASNDALAALISASMSSERSVPSMGELNVRLGKDPDLRKQFAMQLGEFDPEAFALDEQETATAIDPLTTTGMTPGMTATPTPTGAAPEPYEGIPVLGDSDRGNYIPSRDADLDVDTGIFYEPQRDEKGEIIEWVIAGRLPPKVESLRDLEPLPGLGITNQGYTNPADRNRLATVEEITEARAAKAAQTASTELATSKGRPIYGSDGTAYYIDPQGITQRHDPRFDKEPEPDQISKYEQASLNASAALLKEQSESRQAQTAQWTRNWDLQVAETNAALFNNAEKLRWENDKFAVQTAMGRDRLAMETEVSIENALAEQRALQFQYGQLQQDARQFNTTTKIAVDMENARRKELQQARRSQLASQIGQLAQDAGSRGELASTLLANPNLGLLSESLAGGQDFFTEESLAPLSDLLRQREDASRDPNLAKFRAINEIYPPEFNEPDIESIRDAYDQIIAPTQQTDLAGAKNDPEPPKGTDAWNAWWFRQHFATVNPETGLTYGEESDAWHAANPPAGTPPAGTPPAGTPPVVRPPAGGPPPPGNVPTFAPVPTDTDTDTKPPVISPEDALKEFVGEFGPTPTPKAPKPKTPFAPALDEFGEPARMAEGGLFRPRRYAGGGLAQSAYIGDEKGPELHIPLGPGEALVIPHDKVESFLRSASRSGALGDANAIPEMAGGGKVKSQRQINFLLSKNSPLTVKQRARLKKELSTGDVKIPRMEKGGKFPEDSVAGDLVGMGISSMADGGMFDQGTIFGTAKPADQTQTRNFLQQALRRALTGTPWQGRGRAPTPVEVSAPGTDPMVRELAASLSALGTGTPQDVFLRRAAALTPRGISERAGGARRTV